MILLLNKAIYLSIYLEVQYANFSCLFKKLPFRRCGFLISRRGITGMMFCHQTGGPLTAGAYKWVGL